MSHGSVTSLRLYQQSAKAAECHLTSNEYSSPPVSLMRILGMRGIQQVMAGSGGRMRDCAPAAR